MTKQLTLGSFYSLERGVVQLKLVTSGRGRSHPLVGPKRADGVGHEGEQFLVVPQTLTAGQDGAGPRLQHMGTCWFSFYSNCFQMEPTRSKWISRPVMT